MSKVFLLDSAHVALEPIHPGRAHLLLKEGARRGTHVGRVAVKASGYFTIQTKTGKVPDVAHRYCKAQHRTDGYTYCFGERLFSSPPSTSPKGAPVSWITL